MKPVVLVFGVVAAGLVAGGGRMIFLEQSQGARLRSLAAQQHTATMVVPAQRGDIVDTRGRVLAGAVRRPSIFVDPTQIDDPKLAAYSVAPILGIDPVALEKLIIEKSDRGFVWIKRGISDAELHAFNDVRRSRRLEGIGVQHEPERVYPNGRTAAHVLGFVGAEQHGMSGIEQTFDAALAGHDGKRTSVVDVHRRRLAATLGEYVAPSDGASVVLTLDTYLQQRTEEHLKRAVEQFKGLWGTAIVLETRTGEVLAMANYPNFDPTEPFPAGSTAKQLDELQEHVRNRAVADQFEPGSIFKPFVASLAFEERLVSLNEVFAVNGPVRQFGGRSIHDTHAYGSLAFWEVISKSSNIGMGMLGTRLGNERLYRYVRAFGFGDPTGITLPGEHSGQVNDYPRWGPFSTQSIPIGQEIAVTPIQVLSAFSVFCNDGVLLRPRIVRGVVDPTGRAIEDWSRPIAVRRVLDAATVQTFRRDALARVCLPGGTGKAAALADYQVFGKTGTAQVAKPNGGGYIPNTYCGSFVCGAPLGEPRVAVLVTIQVCGRSKYYGGTIAAPAAGAIVADALTYMQVPAEPLLSAPAAADAHD